MLSEKYPKDYRRLPPKKYHMIEFFFFDVFKYSCSYITVQIRTIFRVTWSEYRNDHWAITIPGSDNNQNKTNSCISSTMIGRPQISMFIPPLLLSHEFWRRACNKRWPWTSHYFEVSNVFNEKCPKIEPIFSKEKFWIKKYNPVSSRISSYILHTKYIQHLDHSSEDPI